MNLNCAHYLKKCFTKSMGEEVKCNLVFINIFAFENNSHSSGSDLQHLHSYIENKEYIEMRMKCGNILQISD